MIYEAYEAGQEAAMEKLSVSIGAFGRGFYNRTLRAASPEAKGALRGMRKHSPDFQAALKSKDSWKTELSNLESREMMGPGHEYAKALKGQKNMSLQDIKSLGKKHLGGF